jgi:hypothetical protein
MGADDRSAVWVPLGIFGSIALGVLLIPFRTLTPAANLAFMVLTIVVAEGGGRLPALTTAVVSAMSLNFFLAARR